MITSAQLSASLFDSAYYQANNPDVVAAIGRGQFTSLYQHFQLYGQFENRAPNPSFNAAQYLINNPDVAAAVVSKQFPSAWDHFVRYGENEDRSTGTFTGKFNETAYLAANQDVAAAVANGSFANGYQHYLLYGQAEGRVATNTAGATISASAIPGSNFTLTDKLDNLTGSSGNDTFIGDSTTISVGDQINGGAGTDTLKVYGINTTLPTLTSVEVVDFVNPGTAGFDVSGVAGLTKVKVEQVALTGAQTYTTGAGVVTDLATLSGAAGGAQTLTVAQSATDTTGNLTFSGFQGGTGVTANTAVTVTGAAETTLNIVSQTAKNAVTTLTGPTTVKTVNIAAASDLNVTSLASTAATALNISGAGKVTIAGSDLANTAVTVDASSNTGGVSFGAETGVTKLTFKGGAGNDTISFGANGLAVASGQVLSGGNGTDTIVINDTTPVYASLNAATGFEVLGLGTTGATVDVSQLTSLNSFKVLAGDLSETFSNALATSTFTIDNSTGNTGTVAINNKVGEATTSVTLDYGAATAAKTLTNLTVSSETTVNLVSTGTGTGGSNVITTLANADNSNIVLTGSKDLTITNALAGTTVGSKFDASAFTGKLGLTGSSKADIISGGSGNDTIDGGNGTDIINGGAGNDTITVSTANQQDVITTGAGNDIVKFSGATLADVLHTSAGTTGVVSITDFVAGTDKIDLAVTGGAFTSITLANTQTIASAADLTGVYSGISAIAASAAAGAASAAVINVTAGAAAGTYLYVNDATAGVSNADDMLVKISGLTGTLSASDFLFA